MSNLTSFEESPDLVINKSINESIINLQNYKNLKNLCLTNQQYASQLLLPQSIEYLNLSYNKRQYNTSYLTKLEYLNISHNSIEDLTITTKKLKSLDCSNNYISRINFIPDTLEEFYGYNNNLKYFVSLPNMKYLIIPYNDMCSIPKLPSLVTLNISSNNITKLENLEESLISNLNISNNKISEITNIKNTEMKILNITNNNLNRIENLPNSLTTLFCSSNNITTLKLNDNLKILFCCDNKIRYFDIRQYQNLKNIVIHNNPIEIIRIHNNINCVQFNNSMKTLKYVFPLKYAKYITTDINIIRNTAGYIIQSFFIRFNNKN
jgi:Leucine-rich repeat (LRR) protein